MKRRVYLICQKNNWDKGKPQVLSDGHGKLNYVFASENGLRRANKKVEELNKNTLKNPVHLRKATIIIEEEVRNMKEQQVNQKSN